jgi:hypothetical protein
MEYAAPQMAGRDEPFRSGHSRASQRSYTRTGGPGDRDAGAWAIGARHRDAFRDENSRLLLSKAARGAATERLRGFAQSSRAVGRRQPLIMCARTCAPTVYEELAVLPKLT